MRKVHEEERLNGEYIPKSFFLYMLTQAKKMQFKDWLDLFLLIVSFIPGKIWKMINPHIIVVSEYENLARDNGYWFFKYIRENQPHINAYYPISNKSPDKKKIDILGNAVIFASFKHFLLFWAANKQFTSSKNAGFPSRICEDLVQWNFHGFEYILLNHGLTRGKSTVVDSNKTNFDYICTCSEKDKEIIVNYNNQPNESVIVTGFARHDNLSDLSLKNQIVIMPTWREQFNIKNANSKVAEKCIDNFLKSQYYKQYFSLLNNSELIDKIENDNIKIIFYLHDYAQPYSKFFHSISNNIIIGTDKTYDIQTLLKTGSLLITDYSSVCYDFAYMKKPVIYYQFDREEFEYYQYPSSDSFSYEKDGVGYVCNDMSTLVNLIKKCISSSFCQSREYSDRVDCFFKYRDKNNCKRIFNRFMK